MSYGDGLWWAYVHMCIRKETKKALEIKASGEKDNNEPIEASW